MKNNYEYYRTHEDTLEADKQKENETLKEELEKTLRQVGSRSFDNSFNGNFIYFTDK